MAFSMMSEKSGVEGVDVKKIEAPSTNNFDLKKPIGFPGKVSTTTATIPANPSITFTRSPTSKFTLTYTSKTMISMQDSHGTRNADLELFIPKNNTSGQGIF